MPEKGIDMFKNILHLKMSGKKLNHRLMVLAVASIFISAFSLPQISFADDAHVNALIEVLVERGIIPAGDVNSIKAAVDQKVGRMPSTSAPGSVVTVESNTGVKIKIGAGIRSSLKIVEDDTADNEWSNDLDVDDARLYMTGQVSDKLSFELNTLYDAGNTSSISLLDAIAKYKINDALNIWAGRHIPPSDRSNISGAYFILPYDFPSVVSNYPNIIGGRDDGIMVNGNFEEGKYTYALGAYKGSTAAPNIDGDLLYAGRLSYNFWDGEPGYYINGTYQGGKDILAVGLVGQYQRNGVAGTISNDYAAYNVDVLMEKSFDFLGDGTLTLEGAAYRYDTGGTADQGDAYMSLIGYLFPDKVGPGQFQPHVRYQDFVGSQQLDVGVNYIIKGHNHRYSLLYSNIENTGSTAYSQVLLGAQFQI